MTAAASSPGFRASDARGSADRPSREDRIAVETLLGRAPRTRWRVAVRCPHGAPAVIENDPLDLAGRPFPTRYWLVCRALTGAVARLEAAGGVKAIEQDPRGRRALVEAHARHRAEAGTGVAGTTDASHAKCLHAHLAFALAEGGSPVGDWIAERADLSYPATCCVQRDDAAMVGA